MTRRAGGRENEPDQPHGHLCRMAGGSLAERHDAHQHNALVCEQRLDTLEQRGKFLRIGRRVERLWIESCDDVEARSDRDTAVTLIARPGAV
jgi:hypothetical protein